MMQQVYKHNDTAYIVRTQKPVSHFAARLDEPPNMEIVQQYMLAVGADHALRTQTHFMFCETIADVDFEIIE
jgi:hypothetical protein